MRRFAWALVLLSGCPIGDLTSENDASTQPDVITDDATPNDVGTKDAQDAAVVDAPIDVSTNLITFVQATSTAYYTPQNLALGPVTDGDAVIVVVINGSVTGVSDGHNTYNLIYGPSVTSALDTLRIYAAFGSTGHPTTIHVSTSGGDAGIFYWIYAAEYQGLSAFDVSATGSSMSSAVDGLVSDAANVNITPTLLFSFALSLGDVDAAGTGFIARWFDNGNLLEERVVTTGGSYSATATQSHGGKGDIVLTTFH